MLPLQGDPARNAISSQNNKNAKRIAHSVKNCRAQIKMQIPPCPPFPKVGRIPLPLAKGGGEGFNEMSRWQKRKDKA